MTDNENYCVAGGVDTYNAKYVARTFQPPQADPSFAGTRMETSLTEATRALSASTNASYLRFPTPSPTKTLLRAFFRFSSLATQTDEDRRMLCAGLTVFAPMKLYGVGPGSKVAIAGIGGLGSFAVQFAAALGAEVTALSHQADKEVRPSLSSSLSSLTSLPRPTASRWAPPTLSSRPRRTLPKPTLSNSTLS